MGALVTGLVSLASQQQQKKKQNPFVALHAADAAFGRRMRRTRAVVALPLVAGWSSARTVACAFSVRRVMMGWAHYGVNSQRSLWKPASVSPPKSQRLPDESFHPQEYSRLSGAF